MEVHRHAGHTRDLRHQFSFPTLRLFWFIVSWKIVYKRNTTVLLVSLDSANTLKVEGYTTSLCTSHLNPTPPHPGHGGNIHSEWVRKPVKFPDTEAKILSEVPAPWYSAVQTKVSCVESAVTAFLISSHQTLKSISKRRKREYELRK